MTSARKTRLLALAVVAACVAGAIVWQTQFSREAQIERAYESCLRQFGGNALGQATPGRTEPVAAGSGPALTDSLGKAMEDLVRGVTAGQVLVLEWSVHDLPELVVGEVVPPTTRPTEEPRPSATPPPLPIPGAAPSEEQMLEVMLGLTPGRLRSL